MRIGIYFGNFNPQEGGGFTFQDTLVRELTRQAESSDHTFILFFDRAVPRGFSKIKSVPLRWSLIWRGVRKIKSYFGLRTTSRLQHYVRLHEIDIVWFPTIDFEPVNVPYVFTVWDLQHRLQPGFPEVSLNGQWESREKLFSAALGKASMVTTGTDAGESELIRFYGVPPNRIRRLLHPTPDLSQFAAEPDRLLPQELRGKYLFYPAQFWPHKNHIRILKAVAHLKDSGGPVMPVVFCGSEKGNLGFVRQQTEAMGLSGQVTFLGFVSNRQLATLYKEAFALVFASFFGPENLPPLEAFSLGCPVIAASVDGTEEQLGNAALYFSPRDHLALASEIVRLQKDAALRKTLIDAGYKRAAAYTGTHYIQDVFSIFEELRIIRQCWAPDQSHESSKDHDHHAVV